MFLAVGDGLCVCATRLLGGLVKVECLGGKKIGHHVLVVSGIGGGTMVGWLSFGWPGKCEFSHPKETIWRARWPKQVREYYKKNIPNKKEREILFKHDGFRVFVSILIKR